MLTYHPVVSLMPVLCLSLISANGFSANNFNPNWSGKPIIKNPSTYDSKIYSKNGNLKNLELVKNYLKSNPDNFPIQKNLKNLKFEKVKKSLLGSHYHYQQYINGIPVENSNIIISTNTNGNFIYQVFSNLKKIPEIKNSYSISKNKSYDIVWEDLWVQGKLLSAPKSKLTYLVNNKKIIPVYKTYLYTNNPEGAWEYTISAETGKIINKRDTRIFRKKRKKIDLKRKFGKLADRQVAFDDYKLSILPKSFERSSSIFFNENQKGFVFDPDPLTVAKNNALADGSPAADFEPLYKEIELKDLQKDSSGNYTLSGPWVKIADFETPNTPPSTSSTGIWEQKRGDNAFNDVMTYYFIDKSQRYIQSLFGTDSERHIQHGPIEADSDGVSGSDNSHYIPSENRLAFGHGCVDDNEDADVILHEYGHAIHHSINSNWNGGDTGAMGEGFGDYWAGSYSLYTKILTDPDSAINHFYTNVFNWDAHGTGECWDGRVLNNQAVKYNPEKTYEAHSQIENGISDELWSAPLFLSLVELVNNAGSVDEKLEVRQKLDKAILEGHFGLASNVTMRMMAGAILRASDTFYGSESEISKTLYKNFRNFNIVDNPSAKMTLSKVKITPEDLGENGVIDPGEEVSFNIELTNSGRNSALSTNGTLSSGSTGVVVQTDFSEFGDITGNSTSSSATKYRIAVTPEHVCGRPFPLNISINYSEEDESKNINIPFHLPTGVPKLVNLESTPDSSIPDNDENGITETIQLKSNGKVDGSFSIDVNIQHTFIGDLTLVLQSPQGTKIKLHNETGGSSDDIITNYPKDTKPVESFDKIFGEEIKGDWKLIVIDGQGQDVGTIKSWNIEYVDSYECSSN